VALIEPFELLPLVEDAVLARQRRHRGVVGRVNREDALERLRGALVVDELLVVERGDALE
jgi:hypothetical protein